MADPNHGTVHVMEEEMRDAKQGVFEPISAPRKAEKVAANKMDAAPANKSRKARK